MIKVKLDGSGKRKEFRGWLSERFGRKATEEDIAVQELPFDAKGSYAGFRFAIRVLNAEIAAEFHAKVSWPETLNGEFLTGSSWEEIKQVLSGIFKEVEFIESQ